MSPSRPNVRGQRTAIAPPRDGRKFEVEGERLQRKFVTTHLLESDCAHGAQDKIPREIAARRQMNIHYPLQNEAQVWSGVWPILADGVGLTDGRAVPLPFPPEMRRRIVVGQRERPFYGDKARTDGWEEREQREDATGIG